MQQKDVIVWIRRYFWLPIPVLALLSLWGMLLAKQPPVASGPVASPTVSPIALPSLFPQPTSSSLSKAVMPAGPTPKAIAKASPTAVQPSTYTGKEAAINQTAKAKLLDASVDSLIEMRVAIAQGAGITIGASEGATVLDKDGKTIRQIAPGAGYAAGSDGEVTWVQPIGAGVLGIGSRPYRGRFLLVSNGGNTLVVNYVNLRKYLYGVVPSEVSPSWNMQALKAQAIAARSYALTYYFKPAHSLYHMGSDEYYQVYSGAEKEDSATNTAVDSTAGEFVSYRGGIVESLYAASDDIVAEAFAGKGMSQLGALHLANQGYTYQKILANYYPNTGVGRIEADHE
jgi:stage II sporulation protein D